MNGKEWYFLQVHGDKDLKDTVFPGTESEYPVNMIDMIMIIFNMVLCSLHPDLKLTCHIVSNNGN